MYNEKHCLPVYFPKSIWKSCISCWVSVLEMHLKNTGFEVCGRENWHEITSVFCTPSPWQGRVVSLYGLELSRKNIDYMGKHKVLQQLFSSSGTFLLPWWASLLPQTAQNGLCLLSLSAILHPLVGTMLIFLGKTRHNLLCDVDNCLRDPGKRSCSKPWNVYLDYLIYYHLLSNCLI